MKFEYYNKYINRNTLWKYDLNEIYQHKEVFANLIKDLIKPFKKTKIDKIVGLEALGFITGSAVAMNLKVGFVPVRKGNKLPLKKKDKIQISHVDYSGKKKTFEINKNSIKKGDKILIVDDWVETGTQVKCAIKLIEKLDGKVVGISTIVTEKKKKTQILFDKYNLKAIEIMK